MQGCYRAPVRLHILVIIVALLVLSAARRRQIGRLLVRSGTVGAVIEVDDEVIGAVPMALPFVLKAGSHQVRVHKPGHAPFTDDIRVRSGRDTVIDVELLAMRAVVSVYADTPGARVMFDGRLVGLTPFRGELKPGQVIMEVHAAGHAPHREPVQLFAGEVFERSVTLLALAPEADPTRVAASPWYGQWWVWTAAGAVVAGVVTTAVVLSSDGDEGPPPPRHSLVFDPIR